MTVPYPYLREAPAEIAAILRLRTVAVVGLSPRTNRPSYGVARYLQEVGYRIVPVRPPGPGVPGAILGERVFASLAAMDVSVDIVDVFRRSAFVAGLVDEVLSLPAARRPKALWLQDGVVDHEAARRAHAAGLQVVMDRCMLRDHQALATIL